MLLPLVELSIALSKRDGGGGGFLAMRHQSTYFRLHAGLTFLLWHCSGELDA